MNVQGGEFSQNVQTKIKLCRGGFLFKINKRACTSIRYTRVQKSAEEIIQTFSQSVLL